MSGVRRIQGQILHHGSRPLETVHGPFDVHVCQNLATRAFSFALVCGDVGSDEPILARIHSSCVTSETFGGCDCDCVEQLGGALDAIAEEGRGVVFYLMQEGRGAGFSAKVRDRMIVQASRHRTTTFEAYERLGLVHDQRRYDEVRQLKRLVGIEAPLRLLTNNPEKLAAIEAQAGVEIAGATPLRNPASPWNLHYMASKSRSGHEIGDPAGEAVGAELPEEVRYFEPYLLDDARFLHVATYLLPVRDGNGDGRPGAAHWFRLHAYFDLHTGTDRVVLAFGPQDASDPLVHVQHESLLERFPLSASRSKKVWHRAVRRIAQHGSGYATFVSPRGFDADLEERRGDESAALALIAHHLRGRGAHPLATTDENGRVRAALADAGVRVLDTKCLGRAA